ncbi:hypothetical protein CCACVL1_00099 [Corchorus capsularis]|uniref:Uncharacterized protein n=1 Tax=Corchorus capsularis TaxID=210143 RepID=A0A1R3KYP9_COCAP|nr:hypothetical protein CCACVL1_00099 [Corchorus capsularis]
MASQTQLFSDTEPQPKPKVKAKSKYSKCIKKEPYDYMNMMSLSSKKMGLATASEEDKSKMDEISVVLRKFGDEQSTLLDQFERLSFEVQLNQAILGRSLSEPSVAKKTLHSHFQVPPPQQAVPVPQVARKGRRRGSGFNKVLKKLLKPILGRKGCAAAERKLVAEPQNPLFCKGFGRSLRL